MDKLGKYEVSEQPDGKLLVRSESMSDKVIPAPEASALKINGAWYLDSLPTHMVIELEDNSLKMAPITPMEPVEGKLRDYKGYHPRKCKGQPLPSYLYRFYGLEKSDETANEVIHVRLTPSEKEKVQAAADADGATISEFVRGWIRTL